MRRCAAGAALAAKKGQGEERIEALGLKLNDLEGISRDLACCQSNKLALEKEFRGVTEALSLATKDLVRTAAAAAQAEQQNI